ncbi:MAG TPA: nuclear transport factor 2 family protein [Patescibacteria group bacterium]|nr:nuclear transport factor 2 family protein [Patescibacteria group bacterium]
MKKTFLLLSVFLGILALCAFAKEAHEKPDFDAALQSHFRSIRERDIGAFRAHLTKSETLYTIVQNGHAFTTPAEIAAIHEEWFRDGNWVWEGKVVHKVVGEDMALAVVKYSYRAKPADPPVESWLTYVFALEDGAWKIIHDQNTALDFAAFSKSLSSGTK